MVAGAAVASWRALASSAFGLLQQRRRERARVAIAEWIAPLANQERQRAQQLHAAIGLPGSGEQIRYGGSGGLPKICAAARNMAPCAAFAWASIAAVLVKVPASSICA